jgi:hypothetical protein
VTVPALNVVRLVLALAGFAAALMAVAFEDRRLGWAAIALLAGSLLIRLLHGRGKTSEQE